jgi:hypothetical protein
VRRQAQGVNAEPGEIHRQAPGRLHGVGVDEAAMAVHDPGRLGQRLQGAGLVVGELDRDQDGPVRPFEAPSEPAEVDDPVPVDRDPLDPVGREKVAFEDAGVLGRPDEERFRAGGARRPQAGAQGGVAGLGAAAREDHVPRRGPDERRDLVAGRLDRRPGGAALGMDGGRVAGERQRARHGGRRLGPQGRGGVVVEIGALGCGHAEDPVTLRKSCHRPGLP